VRLLLDANLSPTLREGLRAVGYEVVHVGDVDLLRATDEAISTFARDKGFVVVTSDSDFAAMLALAAAARPSVVHLRGVAELPPAAHLRLLVDNLPTVAEDLEGGAVVSLSPTRLAVRQLPIR
jgi:predicted nuclease of predicted toxin-antitoxin system